MATPDPRPPERRPSVPPAPVRRTDGYLPEDNRSLGDLFRELASETRTLVRQEVQLAKTEATNTAKKAGKHIGLAAAGGFVAYAGLIVLLIGVGALLAALFGDGWGWLGYVLVGLATAVAGYAVLKNGLNGLKNTDFSLEHTAETLKEDTQWMKEEVSEVKNDPKHLGSRG